MILSAISGYFHNEYILFLYVSVLIHMSSTCPFSGTKWDCFVNNKMPQIDCAKTPDNLSGTPISVTLAVGNRLDFNYRMLFANTSQCKILVLHVYASSVISNYHIGNLYDLSHLLIENNRGLDAVSSSNHNFERLLKNLVNVKSVYLAHFVVPEFSVEVFHYCNKVERITLKHLDIKTIHFLAFKNCKKLKYLEITDNRIQQLFLHSFSSIGSLTKLILNFNRIQYLMSDEWTGVSNLLELQLSNNLIEEIPNNFFNSPKKLKNLNLSNNNLSDIKQYTFYGLTQLERIHLENNPRLTYFNLLSLLDVSSSLSELKISIKVLEIVYKCEKLNLFHINVQKALDKAPGCIDIDITHQPSDEVSTTTESPYITTIDNVKNILIVACLIIIVLMLSICILVYCTIKKLNEHQRECLFLYPSEGNTDSILNKYTKDYRYKGDAKSISNATYETNPKLYDDQRQIRLTYSRKEFKPQLISHFSVPDLNRSQSFA